ncbi:MAG: helix-turn-helix transcriptional regulator [Nitrospiraceae bacterium]
MMEPLLLRVQETAKLLKVSKWTIYRWIEEGRLTAVKLGPGSLRVVRTSVDELLGKSEVHDRDARKRAVPIKPHRKKR